MSNLKYNEAYRRKCRRQLRLHRIGEVQRHIRLAINRHREMSPVSRDMGVLPDAVFANGFAEAQRRHDGLHERMLGFLRELDREYEMLLPVNGVLYSEPVKVKKVRTPAAIEEHAQ